TATYTTRVDNTPPTVTQGAAIAACYPTQAAAEPAAKDATTVNDNCTGTVNKNTSTIFNGCDATITVTASDSCGNNSTTSASYTTRVDNTPQTVTQGAAIAACYPTQ